ncbi:hypothetical protein PV325_002977 [Microctonus aethiopoides]|nr:hypothetical protein PV326_012119 [Microctonus aethiopoides]KAK0086573.1 hypothetical protein PV325_002977 [Microctonus aethiopoides]
MLFRRQTSEPTSGPGGTVNITKISPNSPVQSSPTSGPPPSNLLAQWYTKITTNVKKRQNFSPKTLLKKALLPVVDPFLDKVTLADLAFDDFSDVILGRVSDVGQMTTMTMLLLVAANTSER